MTFVKNECHNCKHDTTGHIFLTKNYENLPKQYTCTEIFSAVEIKNFIGKKIFLLKTLSLIVGTLELPILEQKKKKKKKKV